MTIIKELFQPLYGKLCWQVEQGYASFLTFEFGEPHLRIQEPRQTTPDASESVIRNAARRFVYVRGDWHLWIHSCNWRIIFKDEELANSDSNRRAIKKALIEINGQKLTNVTVSPSLLSVFEFDLGGRLEASPDYENFEKTVDLWLLYEPSGEVFTLRADGQYHHDLGDARPKQYKWQPLNI